MTFFYSFDPESAADVVARLTAVEAQLDEVVVDLRWRVQRMHETWAGTAAGAHWAAHEGWSASCVEMHEALTAMRRAARTANDNYVEATTVNASMWDQVR